MPQRQAPRRLLVLPLLWLSFFGEAVRYTYVELSARKFVISNALGLVAAARAHNVLLSSGAARALELRGPYDVANLGLLFGLKADVAKNSIGSTALSAALHGETRRTHKSVLSSVDIARLAHSERWKLKTAEHRSPAAAAAAATTRTSDASAASAAADDAPSAASTTAAAAPAVDDVDMADVPPPPPTVTPPPAAAAPGAQQLSPASPPSVDTCRQQQAGGGATVNTAASQQQQRPRSTAATDGGTLPIARVTPVGGPVGSPAGPPAAKKKKKKKKQETKLQPDGGAVVDPTAADILKRKRA